MSLVAKLSASASKFLGKMRFPYDERSQCQDTQDQRRRTKCPIERNQTHSDLENIAFLPRALPPAAFTSKTQMNDPCIVRDLRQDNEPRAALIVELDALIERCKM